jgi:hypothetical protein
VHHDVVDVAFELDGWEVPAHPGVERVVQEQVGQNGWDRRTLRCPLVPGDHGPVASLQVGGEPPLYIEDDPGLVGVGFGRLSRSDPSDAVEERLDVQIDHPVEPVTTPAAPAPSTAVLWQC